ncbi:MAG: C39 family peptidase [Lachnospiraceae bacterium]|nr:C39 family peptidase [Lachnospiraceae bacterium]
MKQKDSSSKINRLLIILLISVLCLAGIVVYAKNWEKISEIDWKAKGEQVINRCIALKEQIFPPKEAMSVSFEIAEMSHDMPVLTKTAEGIDVLEVPLMNQREFGYQTGCELVSGAMVLNYYGQQVTPQMVYEVIEKAEAPFDSTGNGISPNQYFIGNPEISNGYGCYAGALMNAMNELLNDDWHAVNISGTDLETIEENYLEEGRPVIIWATIHMMEPENGNRWKLEDGTWFQWIAGEHCLVLVGADEHYYYFNDPDHAGEVIGYERELVKERYKQLGQQAIIVSR